MSIEFVGDIVTEISQKYRLPPGTPKKSRMSGEGDGGGSRWRLNAIMSPGEADVGGSRSKVNAMSPGEGNGGGSWWKLNTMSPGQENGGGSRWDILDVVFSNILLVFRHDQLQKVADTLQAMKLNDQKLPGGEFGDGGPLKSQIDVSVC